MAFVTEYTCQSCGLELVDDGRAFVWDGESGETQDFLILMSTYQRLHAAQISGSVSETYCRDCGKYVKVYSIRDVIDGIANPCDVVERGIEKYIRQYGRRLGELKDIRKRSDYLIKQEDGHYVVTIPGYESFSYSNYLFPEMSRQEVIEDALRDFHEEIDGLIESLEKRYQRYVESAYLIVDDTARGEDDFDLAEKVLCPDCGCEINRNVDSELGCPRCGGHIFGMGICYD